MTDPLEALLPRVGDVILDRFRLDEQLGRGGFGVVFKATQTSLDQEVAVKMLLPQVLMNTNLAHRFFREVSVAKGLRHPNTIRILDHGRTDNDIPFYVMEYLIGRDLGEILENEGPIGEDRALHVIVQVLKSLAEAHARGVIHRDMKPTNIMLCDVFGESDFVKVLDFGIAKALSCDGGEATKAGTVLGSPPYMSPEQTKAQCDLDLRSDIYAVGLIMAECLTGKPILPTDLMSTLSFHFSGEPLPFPPRVVSSPLWPVILKATARERDDRFQDASAMRISLTGSVTESATRFQAMTHPPGSRGHLPQPTPAPSFVRKHQATPVTTPIVQALPRGASSLGMRTSPEATALEQRTAPVKQPLSLAPRLAQAPSVDTANPDPWMGPTRPFPRPTAPVTVSEASVTLETPTPVSLDETIPVSLSPTPHVLMAADFAATDLADTAETPAAPEWLTPPHAPSSQPETTGRPSPTTEPLPLVGEPPPFASKEHSTSPTTTPLPLVERPPPPSIHSAWINDPRPIQPPPAQYVRPSPRIRDKRRQDTTRALLLLLFFSLLALGAVIWLNLTIGADPETPGEGSSEQLGSGASTSTIEQTTVSPRLSEVDDGSHREQPITPSEDATHDALTTAQAAVSESIPGSHVVEFSGTSRADILINGESVGSTSDPLWLHNLDVEVELTFERDGYQTETQRINLAETHSLVVRLDRIESPDEEDHENTDPNDLQYGPSPELLDLLDQSRESLTIPILLDSD